MLADLGHDGIGRDDSMSRLIHAFRRTANPFSFRVKDAVLHPKSPRVGRGPDGLLKKIIRGFDVTGATHALDFGEKSSKVLDMFDDMGTIDKVEAFILERKCGPIRIAERTFSDCQFISPLDIIHKKALAENIGAKPGIMATAYVQNDS